MPKEKLVGMIISFISIVLILFILFKKEEPFFNLNKVFKEHLALFSNCKSQYFVFYVFPLVLGVGLSLLFPTNAAFFSHLGVVLSIILSMLLALLAILSSVDFSKIKEKDVGEKAQTAVKQTINAIIFCCVIGIALLLLGFVVIAVSGNPIDWLPFDISLCKTIGSVFTYYLFIVVLLNLLLIIKNMYKIIELNMSIMGKNK